MLIEAGAPLEVRRALVLFAYVCVCVCGRIPSMIARSPAVHTPAPYECSRWCTALCLPLCWRMAQCQPSLARSLVSFSRWSTALCLPFWCTCHVFPLWSTDPWGLKDYLPPLLPSILQGPTRVLCKGACEGILDDSSAGLLLALAEQQLC